MKKLFSLACLVLLVASPVRGAEEKTIDTYEAKVGYMMGIDVANRVKDMPIKVDIDAFFQGLRDQLDGKKLMITEQEQEQLKVQIGKDLQEKQKESQMKSATENKEAGEAFLADNKKKEGVTATASGLQYKVIKAGDGPKPQATDTVEVHYRGTLLNGEEFDSSYKRGQTISFPLNRVIPGWTEGLQLMPVGSKYELYIPSELAYGERGAGQAIGPNSTLIFEVELIGIK